MMSRMASPLPDPEHEPRFQLDAFVPTVFQLALVLFACVICCTVFAIAIGHASDRYPMRLERQAVSQSATPRLAASRKPRNGRSWPPMGDSNP
jgi:hypothetical protein